MNTLGGAFLILTVAYAAFLCTAGFRSLRTLFHAKEPRDLLEAIAKVRRYHGTQMGISLGAAVLVLGIKGLALLTGFYSNPGVFARLAFGTLDSDLGSKLGLVAGCLLCITVLESVLFIRYDAYLRMMFALRKWLGLDLQLSDSDQAEVACKPKMPH